MRRTVSNLLNNLKNKNIFLLHDDLFHFDTFNSINCGITEPSMVDIACGLASQGKTVFVYGICGFVLYRAFDQIKFNVSKEYTGNIFFINAGHTGCYDKRLGRVHQIDDDLEICKILKLKTYTPKNAKLLERYIKSKLNLTNQKIFIRLGNDE